MMHQRLWIMLKLMICVLIISLVTYRRKRRNDNETLRTDVLLNAYMRSGSSFIGKLLGYRDDTFYFYEPLHKIIAWHYFSGKKLCMLNRPSCSENAAMLEMSIHLLKDIYGCNLERIYDKVTKVLMSNFGGPSWKVFRNCTKSARLTYGYTDKSTTKTCYLLEEEFCTKANHRVTKILRMDLDIATTLLESNQHLKIVQLLRDPRAVMSSRIYTDWFPLQLNNIVGIADQINVTCSRMHRDIEAGKQLLQQYPDRVLIIQYEDFDDNLLIKTKLLFKFLGMKFNANDKNSVLQLSNSPGQMSRTFHPFTNRDRLPYSVVKIIDKHCINVYKELGLIRFNDETSYKDKTVSVKVGKLPFALK